MVKNYEEFKEAIEKKLEILRSIDAEYLSKEGKEARKTYTIINNNVVFYETATELLNSEIYNSEIVKSDPVRSHTMRALKRISIFEFVNEKKAEIESLGLDPVGGYVVSKLSSSKDEYVQIRINELHGDDAKKFRKVLKGHQNFIFTRERGYISGYFSYLVN